MTSKPRERSLTFEYIHEQELLEIKKRREKHFYDPTELDDAQPDLIGLALSGGGIRSATFCLGFLQELQRLRLLRIFDYLSTVSGGGYLGGWWSAWLSRQQDGLAQSQLFETEDVRDPVNLLRRINEPYDAVARDLQAHLRITTRGGRLLKVLDQADLRQLAPRLRQPLAEELNSYIYNAKTRELKRQRKADLIDTFPCELRGIFPPPEGIEPERTKYFDVTQLEFDGSGWSSDPIHHVRLFADYLTPSKGILSGDTWRAISAITRNLILTWLILLSLLVGVMLLGQAYLLLNPASQMAFTCTDCPPESPSILLLVLLTPVVILLVSNVAMAIAWLLCNQDDSSSFDSMTQWACLIALASLLIAAIFAIPALRASFATFFALPFTLPYVFSGPWSGPIPGELAPYVYRLRLAIGWLAVLLGSIVIMWHWGLRSSPSVDGYDNPTASSKREVRRGRFSRAQSRLLVATAIVAAVLLVSWLSLLFLKENRLTLGMKIPLTLLPLLWNLRGSIFAMLEEAPALFGDRAARKKASLSSRFVFAVMPLLVVGVLAVAAASFAHWLLLSLYYQNLAVPVLLNVAAALSIALCMGLAIYEMKGVQWSKSSFSFILFICLVMINVSWGAQALLGYTNPKGSWTYLLMTSAYSSVFITALVFRKVIPRGKWRWRLFRHLHVVSGRISRRNKHLTALRMLRIGGVMAAVVLFTLLTIIGFLIGFAIYLNTTTSSAGRISGAIVLTLLAVGGGVILFRILVRRHNTNRGENFVTVRLFSDKTIGQYREALWVTESVCVTLPIVMINVSHYIYWRGQAHSHLLWYQGMTFFPLTFGLLLLLIIVLRSLVIQKQLLEKKPITAWTSGIIDWLLNRIPNRGSRRHIYQASALGSICLVVLLNIVTRVISSGDTTAAMVGPVNWNLLAVAFFVSLPIFVISLFKIPIDASLYPRIVRGQRRWLHSKTFLWFLATVCFGLALILGLLLPSWLIHVSEIPLNTGLTPILLPLAAGCFLIVLFELFWGEGDNQRSLLLVTFAFFAVTSIFFMQLAGAGLDWYLVLGLLAAICVWVGALGWVVDPNSVSMHQFYKERLVRAYLGASNVHRFRRRKEITETVTGDDLPLKSLLNCERGGPYHLINTTLNLAAGRDLATAQRSAASFVLSQIYCGSRRTNYCFTNEYMKGQLTLGTAVAASGATVGPNLGAKNPTATLAMLMTLLNVRLGYWAPTPNRKAQNSLQPRLWPFYIVREFFSQTNDLSDYCYLTDGGYFDNTGLYSLIERGCRFVVLIDCGTDSKPPSFADLGEAIRRCRIDFGTEIDLNLDPFVKSESQSSAPCFVVGKINFAEKHLRSLARAARANGDNSSRSRRTGIIIYFKPSVIANVTADVWQYAIGNEFFPQQPTTNQWFGEAQFESYRRLGQACAYSAFGHIESENALENDGRISVKKIEALFYAMYERVQTSPRPT